MIFFLSSRLLPGFLLALASYADWKGHRIPNLLTAGAACVGLVLALLSGWEVLKTSLIGFSAALAVGILFWLCGVFRAGDAKLYAALGMLLGWQGVLDCFLWSMLAAGVIGFFFLLSRGELGSRLKRVLNYGKLLFLTRRFTPYAPKSGTEHEFPLAPFIALGWLLSIFLPMFSVG